MFWTDELINNLDKKKDQLVNDAWSTSGFAHVGSLRGAVIHQIANKALKEEGFNVKYTFLFDDLDPFDGVPPYLDKEKYEKHLGEPLCNVPAPEGNISLAEYFGNDFSETLKLAKVDVENPKTSEIYKKGLLNDEIKIALDSAEKIREIYKKISGSERPSDWHSFSPICEKCGKIGTTRVFSWDGEKVSYKCEENMVEWAKGCGYEGSVSPFNGNGKLPWRVEWPARWRALGITVEGEGKDHWSAGGSRGMADVLSKEVFNSSPPYDLRYDFIVIGGKKMSSSKGNGITARKMAEMLPVSVLNFLLASAPKKTLEFDPMGDTVPRLFDQYDGAREAFFGRIDFPDKAKAFETSQIEEVKDGYLMRFSKIAYGIQMPKVDIFELAEEEKGTGLSKSEKDDLEERIDYAKKWLKEFAPEDYIFEVQKELPNVDLNETQKNFLDKLANNLKDLKWDGQEIHTAIHNLKKETNIEAKDAFSAIYFMFLGKDSGPQAGWLLSSLDKGFVLKRLLRNE